LSEVWLAFAVALVPWAAQSWVRLKRFLHILQLEEYFTRPYLGWLAANPGRYLPSQTTGILITLVFAALFLLINSAPLAEIVLLAVWGFAGGLFLYDTLRNARVARKPLVMTARARRLLVIASLVSLAFVGVTALIAGLGFGYREGVAAGMIASVVVRALAGHVLEAANLLAYPVEEASRRGFQAQAERRLREQRPRIVAITGSAGKTTTKELVAQLLAARYRVLKTPSSFNTPMGISRTVNDSLAGQDYFVVEMGAYRKGEIEKLCRLVGGPEISVITTVNAQHLERFGSLEKTAEAKFEIVEGLKQGGTAVINYDVPAIRERALARNGLRVLSFGLDAANRPDVLGSNVVETSSGIELDVSYGGKTVPVKTLLLARHNAGNVLAAVGVGLTCGLDLGYMAAAIRQQQSPEHRLQPVKLSNGVIELDDAYNANPEGIVGALEVLGSYSGRRRIVVTPGLVEMGREKGAYHARIGHVAAKTCDIAVLVGPRQTADIKASMLEASFPPERIRVVKSLEEARGLLAREGSSEDVILFANDLPDQYDEELVI
jgi:UDP-N-acetylmuramoyl-tripeptide--D-alanyl-D-alanine ligase